MAFRPPTRQLAQRVVRLDTTDSDSSQESPVPPVALSDARRDSQTWVVFSPATDAGTATSYLSSTQESQPTPGRSRLSDLGSLNTVGRSDLVSSVLPASVLASEALLDDDDDDGGGGGDDDGEYGNGYDGEGRAGLLRQQLDDDAELDSLDSHLPDFRAAAPQNDQHLLAGSSPILPAHDGLGSFRIDIPGVGSEMQERIFAFERFNPRRARRRRESAGFAQFPAVDEIGEAERTRRIEEWRLEQSRALLEEVQEETRRRRRPGVQRQRTALDSAYDDGEEAALGSMGTRETPFPVGGQQGREDHATCQGRADVAEPGEGLLSRLTRRVIHDLMGIDDALLSVLFGEALPNELDELSPTPRPPSHLRSQGEAEPLGESPWQLRILERVARELGLLVNQLAAHPHPGAFSTYVRVQQAPVPYAGLPVIAETAADAKDAAAEVADGSQPALPEFQPTVAPGQPVDAAGPAPSAEGPAGPPRTAFTQQEWEQDLDVKLVFRYLRSRFMDEAPPGPGHGGPPAPPASHAQDAASKAARVRQHHPLVSRARQAEWRTLRTSAVGNGLAPRHASSCASQSTKRSGRRGSLTVSSRQSSRHYWDIGGSIGTGSLIASTGPMGSWGEV